MSRHPLGDDPVVRGTLARRIADRDALLERARAVLTADARIAGAWIEGSIGRRDADALSDLDLHAAVQDEHITDVAAHRREYAARVADPLLLVEGPQNAPPGGAFLLALHDGAAGPQQLDWAWHPRSQSAVPPDTIVLFERQKLSRVGTQERRAFQPVPPRTAVEAAEHEAGFFWAMLLIVAKQHARGDLAGQAALLPHVLRSLDLVQRFACQDHSPIDDRATDTVGGTIAQLRELAAKMETLMPDLARRHAAAPWRIVPAAHCYLDLIERIPPPT